MGIGGLIATTTVVCLAQCSTGSSSGPTYDDPDILSFTRDTRGELTHLFSSYRLTSNGGKCLRDVIATGSARVIPIRNLAVKDDCPAELIIADPSAMQVVSLGGNLTDRSGDTLNVDAVMAPHIQSLAVWIVDGPFAEVAATAARDLVRANEVFAGCGIRFEPVNGTRDVSHSPSAPRFGGAGCGDVDQLRGEIGFEADSVNIYYLKERPHYRGAWCGADSSPHKDVVLLYRSASDATLSHELGHALSLEHPLSSTTI